MKKKILIIIPIIIIIVLLIIGVLAFIFTKKEFIGTWTNITIQNEQKIVKTIIFKRNGSVLYITTNKDKSEKKIKEGKWNEEDDYLSIIFDTPELYDERYIYFDDDKKAFCIDDNCENYQKFTKKSLFSNEREYVLKDEEDWDDEFTDEDDEEEIDVNLPIKEDGEVAVYLFRGEGCPHCQEAEEWFDSIEEEYGDLFEVVDYEVWHSQENSELMEAVAKSRGDSGSGVPYIIIGNKSWEGFKNDYGPEMLDEIKSVYEK